MSQCWECGHGSVLDCLREHLRPTTNWITWHLWRGRRRRLEPSGSAFIPEVWSQGVTTASGHDVIFRALDEDLASGLGHVGDTIRLSQAPR